MNISYSEAARDDVTRLFRYYLVERNLPEIAVRLREGVRRTAKMIREQPRAAPRYQVRNPQLQNLRSCPVTGFAAIRLYFLVNDEAVRVVRVLHGKRDVRKILEHEGKS